MYRGLKFYSDSVSEQSCTINHLLYHEDGKTNTKHVQRVHHSSLWHYDYGMHLAPPFTPLGFVLASVGYVALKRRIFLMSSLIIS